MIPRLRAWFASRVVGGCDQLFESQVGEVVQEGGGVVVVRVFQVEVEVAKEYVVCGGESVRADGVSDGVTEGGTWSWGSVYECASEGGNVVDVDEEVHVFCIIEGVEGVGGDLDGVSVKDGDAASWFVKAVFALEFVALWGGCGYVWLGCEVCPCFCEEDDVG
ncbi:hypothetical protein NDU88_004333 [Pleurodeles waltl]|uniref:Uncharacterized protein n=1 Tax=Pleurodeles waltl TaxID=8319 RepID=A0AAV7SIH6_PLEWA|nr:hypothetical protein NDU88_004333 [Pleurodeles waltl]